MEHEMKNVLPGKEFSEWFGYAYDHECDGSALQAWNAATERAQTALDAQAAEIKALRKDAERLDWLDQQSESYGFQDIHEGNRWLIEGPFSSLHAAIDNAIAQAVQPS